MAWGPSIPKAPTAAPKVGGGWGYKGIGGSKPNAGGRQSAAAQHLGAPKAAPKPKATPKPSKPAGKPPHGKLHGFNLETANQGDIHNRAVTLARLERNQALQPLKAQGAEIQGNEQRTLANYGQLQGAQDTNLQKLGEQQQASAKTLENHAAENVLQASKAIETTGQSQASMTGGYASPELRSQLLSEAQQSGANAGAGSQFAQNIAAASAAQLAQMRGAASLKALGGSQAVSNAFQKQQAGVRTAEQGVLSKVGPQALKLEQQLGQQQFSDRALTAKLASEGVKLGLAKEALGQKGRETQAKLRTTERGQSLSAQGRREANAQKETASQRSAATSERDTILRIQSQVGKASKKTKTASGSLATHDALNKLSAELGAAYQGFVEGRSGKEKLTPAEIRQNLTTGKEGKKGFPKAVNQVLITAAQELYYTHKVSKTTRREMGKLGMNIGYDNEAFHAVSGK